MGVCEFICKERKTENPAKIKNSKNNENNNTISSNKDDIKNTIIETTEPFLPEEEDEINEEQNISILQIEKKHIIFIENKKLKEFYEGLILDDINFEKDISDLSFNEFKEKENKQLKAEINNIREEFEKYIMKMVDDKKISDIKNEEIKSIIENELTVNMVKYNIKKIIENYEKDINKYKIKHLKVVLVGRKKIGKTDLINYMLELKPKEAKKKIQNYEEYTSESVPYLKLVEFEGIGFDKNSNPEKIGAYI